MREKTILKVLIVDDELPIRQRLLMYDWAACGVEIVGEAENGEVALDLCSKWLPDIVMTDIVMPVMNGLELLRVVSETFPDTKMILLTSHTDFEYVHQALKLGAVDYLVKMSLSQQELEQTVGKARARLEHEQSLRVHQQELVRKRLSRQFTQLLASADGNAGVYAEWLEMLKLTQVPFRFIRLFVMAEREDQLAVDEQVSFVLNTMEADTTGDPLSVRGASARDGLQSHAHGNMSWFPVHLGDYFIVAPMHMGQDDGLAAFAMQLVGAIQSTISERLTFLSGDIRVFSAVSDPVSTPEQLRDRFRETFYWLHDFFYQPKQTVFSGSLAPMQGMTSALQARLKAHLLRFSAGENVFVDYLRSGFAEWIASVRLYPNELKVFAAQLLSEWGAADDGKIEASVSLPELVSNMIYLLEASLKGQARPEVRKAKQIIDERLGESVTLAMVAEEVELSADYLGKLFQEQLGESFKDYLTRRRIERAAWLLRNSTMKVYAVAEAVGFPNYRYFSTLFRKVTGMSPTDVKRGEPE
ncbi:helix-turn-helix domain-containing protein [Paenibacillus thalictri]|uniref:Response regulator n=1 Tax=Paenibacillus thalictri TaxID=2527873 RepID=A0A4Q9DUL3_9BACL|nr:helix-turn-helix domain-containing protein [Paenibacillus thalictri]TBL80687.1 response regulator [Paenibacillus thalictri]